MHRRPRNLRADSRRGCGTGPIVPVTEPPASVDGSSEPPYTGPNGRLRSRSTALDPGVREVGRIPVLRIVLIVVTVAITAAFPLFVHGVDPSSTEVSASVLLARSRLLALPTSDNDNRSRASAGAPAAEPPPSPQPPEEASACVLAGQTDEVALGFSGGFVVASVGDGSPLSSDVRLSLRAVDPGSVPGTPGEGLADFVFELAAEDCGGGLAELPAAINLSIHYSDEAAAERSPEEFVLARLEGEQWIEAPEQVTDTNYIGASTDVVGVYAVYQR